MIYREVSLEFYITVSEPNWKILATIQSCFRPLADTRGIVTHVHPVIDGIAVMARPGDLRFVRSNLVSKVMGKPAAVMHLPRAPDPAVNRMMDGILKLDIPSALRAWAWLLSGGLTKKPISCVTVSSLVFQQYCPTFQDPIWPHKLFDELRHHPINYSAQTSWEISHDLK